MTEREAIYHLCRISEIIPGYCRSEAFDVAIGALQKQVPKKPIHHEGNVYCPICDNLTNLIVLNGQKNYCKYCGQKLEQE